MLILAICDGNVRPPYYYIHTCGNGCVILVADRLRPDCVNQSSHNFRHFSRLLFFSRFRVISSILHALVDIDFLFF